VHDAAKAGLLVMIQDLRDTIEGRQGFLLGRVEMRREADPRLRPIVADDVFVVEHLADLIAIADMDRQVVAALLDISW